jgi:hypothetical protein
VKRLDHGRYLVGALKARQNATGIHATCKYLRAVSPRDRY